MTATLRRRHAVLGMGLLVWGCSYGSDPDRRNDYVVFFHDDFEGLDRASMRIVRAAAGAARAHKLDVTVAGYSDAPTSPEANQIRSRIRAQRVADALVALGVARARITLRPRHAVGGDPGMESERVEIRVRP